MTPTLFLNKKNTIGSVGAFKFFFILIVLCLLNSASLAQEQQPASQVDCSTFRPNFPENEKPPLMRRYTIQNLHLGMSLSAAKNIQPFDSLQTIKKHNQLYEYHAEVSNSSEKILLLFTAQQQLYQVIYSRYFQASVSDQDLFERLVSRYGNPVALFRDPNASKILEVCWGQCLMVKENTFCQNETTDNYFTYFTVSLDQSRTQFAMTLNDSVLKRSNDSNFERRYQQKLSSPSNKELDKLNF